MAIKTILIIEDDRFIGEMYVRSLRKAGYDVDWMVDGNDGLIAARGQCGARVHRSVFWRGDQGPGLWKRRAPLFCNEGVSLVAGRIARCMGLVKARKLRMKS